MGTVRRSSLQAMYVLNVCSQHGALGRTSAQRSWLKPLFLLEILLYSFCPVYTTHSAERICTLLLHTGVCLLGFTA